MKNLIVCLSTLLILLSGLATAGLLEDAAEPYDKGNFVQAFKLFQPLAARGFAGAQYHLGAMYDEGQGVAQDYRQAADWFRKAAAQGHALAQTNLGAMYDEGQGVAQDYVRAHMWSNFAAVKGDGNAVKLRDQVASQMTQSQIVEAQKLAKECEKRNYKNCD